MRGEKGKVFSMLGSIEDGDREWLGRINYCMLEGIEFIGVCWRVDKVEKYKFNRDVYRFDREMWMDMGEEEFCEFLNNNFM